ncbi:efflux RND transporter permease subunit [Acinetobacter calcoaceticus]|uniref:efflux RND transporter permease subunit n=1 Tax=Acinetobacter calcoaceticus TaxID=471 RepID=UPI0019015F01|nr:efflux RND transporter permease subunit [Acinetobacter calcoaceticus]MBJ9721116.1 efflux RND transporter permease subunit [Acinetobacter calcoaceticus]
MTALPEPNNQDKNGNGIMQWMQRHYRSLLFLVIILGGAGIAASIKLPVALFPHVDFPRVVVSLDAGDRPVEPMTQNITIPAENAIRQVPNISNIRSVTSRGSAEISVNFDWNVDMSMATSQVNQAIGQLLPNLPPGVQVNVRRMDPTVFPILAYSLRSDTMSQSQLRVLAYKQLRPMLTTVSGVSHVEVEGGTQDEYQVMVDPAVLQTIGLSISDVANALAAANVVTADGRLEDQYKLFLVITNTPLKNETDIGNVVVKSGPDGVVLLKDIATIGKHPAQQVRRVNADGHDAILLNIYQQPTGNSIQIVKDVAAKLASAQLPAGVHLTSWYDQSQLVSASARSVLDAILIGMALAGIVLLIFLRNFKITLIAVVMVPLTLALTTILLMYLNMSFNIMTLGGMAAAVGLIIDDAIVMVEHLVRRLHERAIVLGDDEQQENREQVRQGIMSSAQEFLRPLAGSSASTIVIFIPLAFLTGITGAFFKALSLTMASGLVISFLLTWFVVPMLADIFLKDKDIRLHQPSRFAEMIVTRYQQLLQTLIRRPLLVLLLVLPLLALGGFAFTKVGSGFMPAMDEGGFILDYRTPAGTSLTETDRLLHQVEQIIQKNPNVLTYSRRTGSGLGGGLVEPNQGDFFVRLKPQPREPIDAVMENVRSEVEQKVPGVDVELAQLMEDVIGDLTAVPQPIEVKLFSDDAELLQKIATKTATAISTVNGVVDINPGIIPAGDAIEIHVDAPAAALAGLTTDMINQAVQDAMSGRIATQVAQSTSSIGETPVRVWVPEEQRQTLLDLENLTLHAPNGSIVRLQDVATLEHVAGQSEVTREQMQRMVAVTARISGRDLGSVVADVEKVVNAKGFLPPHVRVEMGGLYAEQQKAFKGLMVVFAAAVSLVFLLLLFLYESFRIAFSVLLIPLCAVSSVFIGLWLTGIELNISAMMGMTMIVGIVTEVAIFFFSEYQHLRTQSEQEIRNEDDQPPSHLTQMFTLIEAGKNRMRPIAMTTLAAILTLLPLAFALGEGSAMQQPLAIAIISGLIVQFPLVLIVMPVVFSVLSKHQK